MKSWKFSKLALGIIVALGSCLASAQTAATPPMGQGGMNAQQARGHMQWLAQQLNLTDEQKEKLRPIMMKEGMDMKAVRDDTSMSPEDKHEKMKAIHDKYRPDIRAILTPEQQEKFDKMKEESMDKHQGMQGGEMSHPQ